MTTKEYDRDGVPEGEKSWAAYDEAADAQERKEQEEREERERLAEKEKETAEAIENQADGPEPESEPETGEEEPETNPEPDTEPSEETGPFEEIEPESEYAESYAEDFNEDFNAEEDETAENLAEIAERILGARHSRASTAAPIRTRGDRKRDERLKTALAAGIAAADPQNTAPAEPGNPNPTAPVNPNPTTPVNPDPAAPTNPNPPVPAVNPAFMRTGEGPAVNPAMMNTAERKAVNPAAFMNTAERQALRAEREKAAAQARAEEEAARKKKRILTAVIAFLCTAAVLGTAVGIGIAASKKSRAAKLPEDGVTETNGVSDKQEQSGNGTGEGSENPSGNATTDPTEPSDPSGSGESGEGTGSGGEGAEDNTDSGNGTEPAGNTDGQGSENPGDAQTGGTPSDNAETPPDEQNQNPPADETPADNGSGGTEENPPTPPQTDPEPAKPDPQEPAVTVPAKKFRVEIDFYNRAPLIVETEPTNLGSILSDNGITLKDGEQPSIGLWDWLTGPVTCSVDLYEYVYEDEIEVLPYQTEEIGVDTIPRGTTESIQAGVNGEKVSRYLVAKKNGVEFDRRLEREEVTSYPQNEQHYIGVGGWLTGKDGSVYSYSWRRVCPATYYSTQEYTYAGTYVSSQTAAADFSRFPLGTKLYVRNDRYDFGFRVVEDTGERLDPWQIDLWMDGSDPNYALMTAEEYVYDMVVYFLD